MTKVTLVKRVVFLFVLVCLSACATAPVPTQTLIAPTPILTATSSPTSTATPTVTTIATVTPTGTLGATPSDTPRAQTGTLVAYDRNPKALLIEADVSADETVVPRDMHVPLWRLYGDGTVVFAGVSVPLSSGLDAVVRVGHLSESEIQNLFAYLSQVGFFALNDSYQPQGVAADAATAHISVYLTKVKTVSVLAPDSDTAPPRFIDAMKRITQTVPADAQTFAPTDAYLESTDAGAVSSFGAKDLLTDWAVPGVRLADATDGMTLSGNAFVLAGAIISNNPTALFQENNRVYSVRFAPNIPRAVHLSDWVGTILAAPREFDGRTFDIVGYYRGANLFGEASGNPPVTRSDWVIADNGGAIYVTGALPQGLDLSSRMDAWSVVRLTARVVYVRLGTSHMEARRVDVLSRSAPTPTLYATLAPASATSTATIVSTRVSSATPSSTATRTITATVAP